MEILRTIGLYSEDKDLPFLLIGGQALNFLGLSRQTGDIDLVVRGRDAARWRELLARLRYKAGQCDERFARFRSEDLATWPIDLMLVDDATFGKLNADAVAGEVGVASVRVVSARHLAMLKIHALKHFQEHRFAKDYGDLLWLLRSGKPRLAEKDLRELCERYASLDLFQRLMQDLRTA